MFIGNVIVYLLNEQEETSLRIFMVQNL